LYLQCQQALFGALEGALDYAFEYQSIGISESFAALFIVYSNDICDCDNRIIRILKVKLGAILQIGSLII
jgi:hypothetical protein